MKSARQTAGRVDLEALVSRSMPPPSLNREDWGVEAVSLGVAPFSPTSTFNPLRKEQRPLQEQRRWWATEWRK